MNIGLLESLYSKYIYKDAQGVKSSWKRIMEDYKKETGTELVLRTARKNITPEVRERLWAAHKESGGKKLPPSTREISGNGKQTILAYQEMSEEDSKNPDRVMEINGFDPSEWDLIKLKVSEWTMGEKNHNYSIALEVKPKLKSEVAHKSIQDMIDTSSIVPEYIDPLHDSGDNFLLLPLTDMHIGVADYEYYKPHQIEINDLIINHKWDEIVFTIGSDLFHNNDFRGQTASGTLIEKVDMEKAWEHAMMFYKPLLVAAQKHAQHVEMLFIKGNHDEAMSWAFVKALTEAYPNIKADTSFIEAKCIVYKNNAIAITHGDKGNDAKLAQTMRDLFELEMNGKSKYIIRGHIHTQKMLQFGSVNLYALGTAAKTDQWHQDNFYIGNMKQFEVFVFNEHCLKEHKFIDGR